MENMLQLHIVDIHGKHILPPHCWYPMSRVSHPLVKYNRDLLKVYSTRNWIPQTYRVTFLTGPAQKSSKYGTGPTQQQKINQVHWSHPRLANPAWGTNQSQGWSDDIFSCPLIIYSLLMGSVDSSPSVSRPPVIDDHTKEGWRGS